MNPSVIGIFALLAFGTMRINSVNDKILSTLALRGFLYSSDCFTLIETLAF
jgi:hypothetical protein